MKVCVTLEFDLAPDHLMKLRDLGWEAAQSQFTDRAEWDEYRSDSSFGRLPHEYDLVEIILNRLWAGDREPGEGSDLEFLHLEDTHTITQGQNSGCGAPAPSYHALHDGLSDMIEGGRLTREDIPDDYDWLVESLEKLS